MRLLPTLPVLIKPSVLLQVDTLHSSPRLEPSGDSHASFDGMLTLALFEASLLRVFVLSVCRQLRAKSDVPPATASVTFLLLPATMLYDMVKAVK